jgi:isopentenyl-diphosphate Delta-isomerase
MSRQARKLEHLWHAVRSELNNADFNDINLINNCMPELSLAQLDLSTTVAGIRLESPFFINAITGGVDDAQSVNAQLAEAARECGLALAVGSQMAALEDKTYEKTFRVVRDVYPDGIIFANIGAYATPKQAAQAVDMLEANALQIHLNVPQELMMAEGDTNFRGYQKNIERIISHVNVPVIVKEVGFGVACEQARIFAEIGVAAIDVGGKGGTNFIQIERRRSHQKSNDDLMHWGIPTAISLLEAKTGAPDLDIIASGGINTGLLVAKALALGAHATGMAGMAVKILLSEGPETLVKHIRELEGELMKVMVMTGAHSITALREIPIVITGFTRQWADDRGLDAW